MPTRKDFRAMALTISKIPSMEARKQEAEFWAKAYAVQNPRFNRRLFMEACHALPR